MQYRTQSYGQWVTGRFIINVDSSFLEGTTTGAIYGVCRDSSGKLIRGLGRLVNPLGVLEGLRFALAWTEVEREVEMCLDWMIPL